MEFRVEIKHMESFLTTFLGFVKNVNLVRNIEAEKRKPRPG